MSDDRPKLSPEAQRLLDARNEAITELKGIDGKDRDICDPNVVRLAAARIFEQSVVMRMLAGENVASSELKNASDMVAAAREALPQQALAVKLTIVKPVDAAPPRAASVSGVRKCRRCGWQPPHRDRVHACYRCGWKDGDDTAKPWKPIDLSGGPSPEQASTSAMPDVRTPAAEPAANVMSLQPPRRNFGSIQLGSHKRI